MSDTALRARPAEFAPPAVVDRMRARALSVGVLFAVIAAVLAYNNRVLFLRAWLFSFMFWLGLTLGPLVLIMLQYASGGHWGRLGRRFWEAATRAIPLMFLFWLPLAFGMNYLFPWTHMSPDVLGASKAKYYLNPTWFVIRGVFYFVGWGFLAWRMNRWSRREEAGETNAAQFVAIQGLSGAGIVFYGLTITFAAIDWVMSLNPLWWS
ncbi:MAG TPA: hypothetical protein VEW69_02960, partial [Alphaproteobacteria bacterium]|nr:hypothetical protein [Alphaproteobacteria bacterium]